MGTRPNAYLMYGYRLGDCNKWEIKEVDEYGSVAPMSFPWFAEGPGKDLVDEEGWVCVSEFIQAADDHLRANDINPKTELIVTDTENGGYYLICRKHHADWDADKMFGPEHFQIDRMEELSLKMALSLLGFTPNQFEPRWILAATE